MKSKVLGKTGLQSMVQGPLGISETFSEHLCDQDHLYGTEKGFGLFCSHPLRRAQFSRDHLVILQQTGTEADVGT